VKGLLLFLRVEYSVVDVDACLLHWLLKLRLVVRRVVVVVRCVVVVVVSIAVTVVIVTVVIVHHIHITGIGMCMCRCGQERFSRVNVNV